MAQALFRSALTRTICVCKERLSIRCLYLGEQDGRLPQPGGAPEDQFAIGQHLRGVEAQFLTGGGHPQFTSMETLAPQEGLEVGRIRRLGSGGQ